MDYTELALELHDNMQSLRTERSQRQINESMHGEAFVLHYIACHGEAVLPSEISDEMNVSSARIAQTLNSMENKGLITRQIDVNDRRKILVNITREGKKLAEKHHKSVLKDIAKMLSMLGEHDAREYVRITGKLAKVITKCKESV
ncbi:MAG: MarR family winged helix-turn-helix transcriptional regulator [Lachnospiraceae bacterium]